MPKSKIKVGVIFGGRSGEHEVSLVSAQSVIDNLDKKKYQVISIGITKVGFFIIKNPMQALKSGKIKEKGSHLIPEKILSQCDVLFPVLHGTYGEDGTIQGMLEMGNIAYVGADVLGSAIGMDKVIQKQLFVQDGLPVVDFLWFKKIDWLKNQSDILRRIEKKLKYPVFVKPVTLGSSVGISKVKSRGELKKAINLACRYDRKIIVEQGIENIYEIEVSVLGNDNPKASVPGEIIASNEFYDYDAKYVDGKSQAIIPAKLPKKVVEKVRSIAIQAFKTLDLCGMARIDFFVKRKNYKIYLSEANTIPGFTSISMYPKLWQTSGLPYPKLLDKLIELAIQRHQEKNKLATSFQPKKDWYK